MLRRQQALLPLTIEPGRDLQQLLAKGPDSSGPFFFGRIVAEKGETNLLHDAGLLDFWHAQVSVA